MELTGNSAAALLREIGVSPEKSLFFGDGLPALDGFACCGLGIAVTNAESSTGSGAPGPGFLQRTGRQIAASTTGRIMCYGKFALTEIRGRRQEEDALLLELADDLNAIADEAAACLLLLSIVSP